MNTEAYPVLRPVTEGAVALALAQVLGYVRLFTLPEGGDVSLSMAPLIVFALRWGVGKGALLGLAYGILGALLRWDWIPIGLGRALACAALGTAGLFRGRRWGALYGALTGIPLRAAVQAAAGALLLPEETPERFLNLRMNTPETFYALHELLWASLNLLPCLLALALLSLAFRRFLLAEDLAQDGDWEEVDGDEEEEE